MTYSLGKQRILVLGGGYAGMVGAARAARGVGRLAEVTLIDARPAFVQRIRLREALAGSPPKEAAARPIHGADKISRFLIGLRTKARGDVEVRPARINGRTGVLTFLNGTLVNVVSLDIEDGRIRHVYIVVNPDKLPRV